jgi:hypothetical protein
MNSEDRMREILADREEYRREQDSKTFGPPLVEPDVPHSPENIAAMRKFETGATRNVDAALPDYEGFLSPLVLRRYGEYMNEHRVQADGTIRDSDNWQRGIPFTSYMKSLWRHVMDTWLCHRGHEELAREDIEKALCGVLFNASGMLHEILKETK